jgi:hypothetical protein
MRAEADRLAPLLHVHAPRLKDVKAFSCADDDIVEEHFRHTLKGLMMNDAHERCRKCETELGEWVSACYFCANSGSHDEE